MELTPRQENFCHYFLETGSQSEAYRMAYNVGPDTLDKTVHEAASRLANDSKVSARIAELREGLREEARITRMDLIRELEEARALAVKQEQYAGMINATMGKSKILGYDKQTIDLESGGEPMPTLIERVIIRPGDVTTDTTDTQD